MALSSGMPMALSQKVGEDLTEISTCGIYWAVAKGASRRERESRSAFWVPRPEGGAAFSCGPPPLPVGNTLLRLPALPAAPCPADQIVFRDSNRRPIAPSVPGLARERTAPDRRVDRRMVREPEQPCGRTQGVEFLQGVVRQPDVVGHLPVILKRHLCRAHARYYTTRVGF